MSVANVTAACKVFIFNMLNATLGVSRIMASQVVPVEKRLRMSLLLDTYGELLTEKQRSFLRSYYDNDFSFGEIASESGVSRQAIFDSVKHGEASLENYERVLKLIAGRKSEGASTAPLADNETAARLRQLADRLSAGENPAGIAEEMRELALELETVAARVRPKRSSIHGKNAVEANRGFVGAVFGNRGPEID